MGLWVLNLNPQMSVFSEASRSLPGSGPGGSNAATTLCLGRSDSAQVKKRGNGGSLCLGDSKLDLWKLPEVRNLQQS